MVLSDRSIKQLVEQHGMIDPFIDKQVSPAGGVSYGLGPCSYDMRLSLTQSYWRAKPNIGRRLYEPHEAFNVGLRPNSKMEDFFDECYSELVILEPYSFTLACTEEKLSLPNNVVATAYGKSTIQRMGSIAHANCGWVEQGVFVQGMLADPAFSGHITVELHNLTPHRVELVRGEGIIQVMFQTCEDPQLNYEQKGGKYQGQSGTTFAK